MRSSLLSNIVGYIPVVGLLLLIASLPFHFGWVQRLALYVASIGYLIDYGYNHRWEGWHWSRDKWVYVVLIALFLLLPIWQLFDPTPPTSYYLFQLHQRAAFVWVSVIGLLGFSPHLSLRKVGSVMLLTSVYMLLFSLCAYWDIAGLGWNRAAFNMIRTNVINSHMVMNLYMNTAIIFAAYTIQQWQSKWAKYGTIVLIAVVWCFILLTDGRVGFMTSLLIMGYFFLSWSWKYSKNYIILICALVISVVAGVVLVKNNERLAVERVFNDPRFAIWDYSVRRIEAHPWLGYGLSTHSEEYVNDCYRDSVMYHGFIQRTIEAVPSFRNQGRTMITHHPHNAFMEYWLENGIIGLLLFIGLFVAAACMTRGKVRICIWLFLLAFGIQCMFEPVGDHLEPQFIALMLFCMQREIVATSCRNDGKGSPSSLE